MVGEMTGNAEPTDNAAGPTAFLPVRARREGGDPEPTTRRGPGLTVWA
jgi:hypothetical protein